MLALIISIRWLLVSNIFYYFWIFDKVTLECLGCCLKFFLLLENLCEVVF